MEITIDLSKQVFQDVSILAKRRKKSVGKLIKQAVLREMQESAEQEQNIERPLADCSDEEVLATAKLMMPKEQSDEMSDLLYKNQNSELTLQERNMLDSLMVVYQLGNLRKSQGIYEAFLRGLIKTPEDLQ